MPKSVYSDGFETGGTVNPQFALCHITTVADANQVLLDSSAQLRWHLTTIDKQEAATKPKDWENYGTTDGDPLLNRTWPVMDTIRPGTITKTGDTSMVGYVVTGVVPCYLPQNADMLKFKNLDVLWRTGKAPKCGDKQMAWWTVKMKGGT